MSKIRPNQIQQYGATVGQTITWDGTKWAPTSPPAPVAPLLSDSDSSALLSEDGTDWIFSG